RAKLQGRTERDRKLRRAPEGACRGDAVSNLHARTSVRITVLRMAADVGGRYAGSLRPIGRLSDQQRFADGWQHLTHGLTALRDCNRCAVIVKRTYLSKTWNEQHLRRLAHQPRLRN